ncbi:O-antigen ligase family protein [Erythrobacter alti]|uniref:O-antigen ligase family protein n=1 Tax=Erythrobacter alti TaxID=1896145 RepID=UPI0030F492B7
MLSLFLGGGGVAYGLRNLAIQFCALIILAVHPDQVLRFVREAPTALRALVFASVALPLVQLVPLPPLIWQNLPGREPISATLNLVGTGAQDWFPASVDPARTLVAFCGTLAPATIIILGSLLAQEQKLSLVRAALWASLAAFALGAVQLASANNVGLLYAERTSPNTFYATFTNRNSTALLFVMATALLAALPRPRNVIWSWGVGAVALLFALSVVLTQSRTGMALLLLVAVLWLMRLAYSHLSRRNGSDAPKVRTLVIALAGVALLGGALGASFVSGGRVADSVKRFSTGAADRPEIWEDGAYTVGQYWPVGSGMGTFDEVFQLHESLEYVSSRKAGRAHSDWLEIAIEGGLGSLLLAAGWLIWSLVSAIPRRASANVWPPLAAGTGVACIALQSAFDYPLRNQTLLCFAALLIVMLVREKKALP